MARCSSFAASVAVIVVALVAPANAPAATCAGSDTIPSADNLKLIRSATLCLLNQQRRAARLTPLRSNLRLQRAATAFSAQMVRERFFDHTAPDGSELDDRVQRVGYTGWRALAENIAWGSGSMGTPAKIVDGWMHSSGHRRNILDGNLREIGVGVAPGAPQDVGDQTAATYTTDFGRRT